MKVIKIIIIILLCLLMVAVMAWGALYYLVWPKPEIPGLVPGAPLVYIAASNLDKTVSAVGNSEFLVRVRKSPLWEQSRSSQLGRRAKQEKSLLEKRWMRSTGKPIDYSEIVQLIKRNSLLAFYVEQGHPGFLLISEVSLLARLNLTSGSTKRALAASYEFATEKYGGVELMTLRESGLEFSYCFIGRAGLLSLDKSLLKKAIDLHRGNGKGLTAAPGYKKMVADPPESSVSFYIDAASIREIPGLPHILSLVSSGRTDKLLSYLTSVAKPVDTYAGTWFYQNGDLRFDARMFHPALLSRKKNDVSTRPGTSEDVLPAVPANCLFFSMYETLDANIPFEMLRTFVDLSPDAELPVLRNGMATAILEPNVKELQVLPPVMAFLRVKDRADAAAALKALEGSVKIRRRQLEFTKMEYEDTTINFARVPIGMGMSIDAGYAFIGDDLLVIATDISALEAAVDVSIGKRQSLTENQNYAGALAPIVGGSDGRIFMNIEPAAMITKQAARLYSWRAKIAGETEAEQISAMLYENAFILETWDYMGMAFSSDGDTTDVKLILSRLP